MVERTSCFPAGWFSLRGARPSHSAQELTDDGAIRLALLRVPAGHGFVVRGGMAWLAWAAWRWYLDGNQRSAALEQGRSHPLEDADPRHWSFIADRLGRARVRHQLPGRKPAAFAALSRPTHRQGTVAARCPDGQAGREAQAQQFRQQHARDRWPACLGYLPRISPHASGLLRFRRQQSLAAFARGPAVQARFLQLAGLAQGPAHSQRRSGCAGLSRRPG